MRMGTKILLSAALPVFCALCLTTTPAQEGKKSSIPAKASLNGTIGFLVGSDEAAIYRFGGDLAKPIIWPLKAPNNKEVTRAWPMRPAGKGGSVDHKHQKSVWFTYGDVIPEGIEIKHKRKGIEGIDFWAEEPGCGCIICRKTPRPPIDDFFLRGKSNYAIFSDNEWLTADGKKIMTEENRIQFFNYTTGRLIVVDILLRADVVPITFGDTKEGAFAVRVADSMTEKAGKGRITNAEGKVGEKQCWGRISNWCDYSGPVDGETVGIAIFAFPHNPLVPDNPPPTCWHCRAYGLMAANPFGRAKSGFPDMKDKKDIKDLVHLDKSETLFLRYGIFAHLGDVKEGKVAEAYELFKKMK